MRVRFARAWLLGAVALVACGPAQPTQQPLVVTASEENARGVDGLVRKAGFRADELAAVDSRWAVVAEAGVSEIDRLCDEFLARLFRGKRDQGAAREAFVSVGAGMAARAAKGGIASAPFDIQNDSILFTVEPAALRAVALRGRQSYLRDIPWQQITTRPQTMLVLQGYLMRCTPATLEANMNNAAIGMPPVGGGDALRAAMLAAPVTTLIRP